MELSNYQYVPHFIYTPTSSNSEASFTSSFNYSSQNDSGSSTYTPPNQYSNWSSSSSYSPVTPSESSSSITDYYNYQYQNPYPYYSYSYPYCYNRVQSTPYVPQIETSYSLNESTTSFHSQPVRKLIDEFEEHGKFMISRRLTIISIIVYFEPFR